MGIALPQLAPASEDRVSGAQVIDGSLKFDSGSSNYLNRTEGRILIFSTNDNRDPRTLTKTTGVVNYGDNW